MKNDEYKKELWTAIKALLVEKMDIASFDFEGHSKDRMRTRKVTRETAFDILTKNSIHEMFKEWEYPYGENPFSNPDPVFTIVGKDSTGTTIAIPIAIKENLAEGKHSMEFYPVTVISTNSGRHVGNIQSAP